MLLLLIAALSGSAMGDTPPPNWTPNSAPANFDPAQAPDAAAIAAGFAQQQAQDASHEQWLDSAAAQQERSASETAYTDTTASQATALLADQFPDQLAMLNSDPARILTDADIEKVLGTFAAKVAAPDGQPALLSSPIPIRDPAPGGATEQVDLSLDAQGSGYVPENGLAYVKLPANASDPIQMGGGLSVDPDVDPASAHPFGDMNLFYPEVDTDTDMLLSPVAGGFEASDQLRSPDAPEDLSFHLNLPAGAGLHSDGAGGAIVSDGSGQLARIPAPSATDAQGNDVPVTMEVAGSDLQLHVSHQGADLAYPILVDPWILENWQQDSAGNNNQLWTNNQNLGALNYWFWSTNVAQGSTPYNHSTSCIATCFGNRGLFVRSEASSTYAANSYGQWLYTPPGSTSYMVRSSFLPIFYYPNSTGCTQTEPHSYVGVFDYAHWSWSAFSSYPGNAFAYTSLDTGWLPEQTPHPPGQPEQNLNRLAIAGIGAGNSGASPGANCGRDLVIGGAMMWISDNDWPSLTASSPTGWADQNPIRIPVSATDTGLGVRYFSVSGTNTAGQPVSWLTGPANAPGTSTPCTGLSEAPCPSTWDLSSGSTMLNFDPSVLPEGPNTLQVAAWDPLHWPNLTKTVTVNVDHNPPSVSLSGSITQQASLGTQRPRYNVHVVATDSATLPSAVTIKVDGQALAQPGCAPAWVAVVCDVNLLNSSYAVGHHTLTVQATDPAGHSSPVTTQGFDIARDTTAPTMSVSGPIFDAPSALMESEPHITAHADDPGAGATALATYLDGVELDRVDEPCADGGCTLNEDFDVDLSQVSAGTHAFTIKAFDGAGNTTTRSQSITVDPAPPALTITGPIADNANKPLPPSTATTTVVAQDGTGSNASGVASVAIKLDGQVVASQTQPCTPQCPSSATLNYLYSKATWGAGPHEMQATATDKAGNVEAQTIGVDVPEEAGDPNCSDQAPAMVNTIDAITPAAAVASVQSAHSGMVADTQPTTDPETGDPIDPSLGNGDAQDDSDLQMVETLAAGASSGSDSADVDLGNATCLSPTRSTPNAAEPTLAANDAAAVYANSGAASDTVVRAQPYGATLVQHLRTPQASTNYSWSLGLADDESVQSLSNGSVAITTGDPPTTDPPVPAQPQALEAPSAISSAGTQMDIGAYDLARADQLTTADVAAVIAQPYAVDASNHYIPTSISATNSTVTASVQVNGPGAPSTIQYPVDLVLRLSADVDRNDCFHGNHGGHPCGRYDIQRAVNYAEYWSSPNEGHVRNPIFRNFDGGSGGNCTNFASQVLHAGRLTMMNEFSLLNDHAAWFYQQNLSNGNQRPVGNVLVYDRFTPTWVRADSLPRHLWIYGLVNKVVAPDSNIDQWQAGDIIFEDWGKDGQYEHTQIVTRIASGDRPIIAQESDGSTKTYHGKTWGEVKHIIAREGFGHLNDGWRYIVLQPVATSADSSYHASGRTWNDL